MTAIATWFLMCCALTYLITEAGLFTRSRTYLSSRSTFVFTLLYCRKCMGFWVGAFSGLIGRYPLPIFEPIGAEVPAQFALWVIACEAGMVFMALMWLLDGSLIPARDMQHDMTIIDMWRAKRGKEKWFA